MSEILQGFRKHFESLANGITDSKYDEKYHNQVLLEVESIKEIVKNEGINHVTLEELEAAVAQLNTGNTIFEAGVIPHCLKTGLLTPIFKSKGERNNSKNYRGITVLPVIGKILEAIIKNRIQETLESNRIMLRKDSPQTYLPWMQLLSSRRWSEIVRTRARQCTSYSLMQSRHSTW